jgi:hypothetical protein
MEALKNKSSSLASTVRWVARILCILAIAFISLFALDVFEEGSLGQKILAFLLHMVPSFVLIIILVIAWKHELVGGIAIALIGLAMAFFIYILNYGRPLNLAARSGRGSPGLQAFGIAAMVSAPFIIAGVLFIISSFLHRPKKLTAQTP